jgi:hypothetical protein
VSKLIVICEVLNILLTEGEVQAVCDYELARKGRVNLTHSEFACAPIGVHAERPPFRIQCEFVFDSHGKPLISICAQKMLNVVFIVSKSKVGIKSRTPAE